MSLYWPGVLPQSSPLLQPSMFFRHCIVHTGAWENVLGLSHWNKVLSEMLRVVWHHRAQVECWVLTVVTICRVRLRKQVSHLPLTGVYLTCSNRTHQAVGAGCPYTYKQLESKPSVCFCSSRDSPCVADWTSCTAPPGMKWVGLIRFPDVFH